MLSRLVRKLVTVDDEPLVEAGASPAVTVYWRPGCFFCGHLLRGLKRHGVVVELRNIWVDDEARAFVRRHNRGNETVPTVVVGSAVWTNPDVRTVTEAVRAPAPPSSSPGR